MKRAKYRARRETRVRARPTEVGYSEDFGSGRTEQTVAGARAYRWIDRDGHFESGVGRNNVGKQRWDRSCGKTALAAKTALARAIGSGRSVVHGVIVYAGIVKSMMMMRRHRIMIVSQCTRRIRMMRSVRAHEASRAHRRLERHAREQHDHYDATKQRHPDSLPDASAHSPAGVDIDA